MTDNMLGWELLFRASKPDIKKKEDVILMLIHYSLLKSDFKCYGKSENWSADETGSELLPAGWNSDKEYAIRYKRNEDKFLLMSSHSDVNVIIFNLTVSEKLQVSNLICNYDDKVTSLEGEISSIIPTYKSLLYEVQEKLISPLITSNKTHVETQTVEQEKKSKDFSKIQYGRPIHSVYPSPDGSEIYVPSIGRRDLDPFGVGSAGNLFDPFTENRSRLRIGQGGIPEPLPRGSVPPRARFDPFGPPDLDIPPRRRMPDLDDMFS